YSPVRPRKFAKCLFTAVYIDAQAKVNLMKRSILIALLLLLWIFPSHAAEYQAEDCPFQNRSPYQIDCGFVTVPLDHANPEGETIHLAVAIIRSNNPDKAPDPVLYLEGGPGGAPVQAAPL